MTDATPWWNLTLLADTFAEIERENLRVAKVYLPVDFRRWLETQGTEHLKEDGTLWGAWVRTSKSRNVIEVEAGDYESARRPRRPKRGTTARIHAGQTEATIDRNDSKALQGA